MACFSPVPAYRTPDGSVVMLERKHFGGSVATLTLACGRCIGCRTERARQWTVRVMHEASQSPTKRNCFVTLTYEKDPGGLVYPHFQLFMRYLRRKVDVPIRFYMCGEYGEKLGRPHYHAALFNVDFSGDRYVWRDFGSGFIVYRSPLLESCWPHGSSSIGELTPESAGYIARYVNKKVFGDLADAHYQDVDQDTGEVTWREPEFTHMSLRPGIGATWFEKFQKDCYPHDRVVVRGKVSKPPRYYDRLYKRKDKFGMEEIKAAREVEARKRYGDNTHDRLLVREQVTKARLSFYRRKLK